MDDYSRLNEDELRRFYVVANGDFGKFLSSVKKTIRWRQEYTLLSPQELKAWDNLVYWHGYDELQRPSLIIRFGIACANLDLDGQAQFVRAVGMHFFLVTFACFIYFVIFVGLISNNCVFNQMFEMILCISFTGRIWSCKLG